MTTRPGMLTLLALMLMLSLGCSLLRAPLGPGTLTPSPTDEATSRPSATPQELTSSTKTTPTPAALFTLTVRNASPYPICEVYITSIEAEDWGDNWLVGERIQPGAEYRFAVNTPVVDVEVWTCDNAVLTTFWDLDTDTTLDIGETGMETVRLVNQLGTDICAVYIAPFESTEWGETWLPGHEVVEVNGTRLFFLPWGLYDAMLEDCDGNIVSQDTLPVLQGGLEWVAGSQWGPGDRFIYIFNRSDYEICGLYMGPPASEFGPNLVGHPSLITFSPALWAVEADITHPLVVLVEDCDGLRLDYNPEVYAGNWVVIGGEGLVPLEIYNYTDAVICEVYISPSASDSWGENWLMADEVINPQTGARVFFVEPGTYDLLTLDCNGDVVAKHLEGKIGENGAYWKLNP